MTHKDMTGYCGLYCGDCIRFQCRASDLAADLLTEIDTPHFREYAQVKRVHAPEFDRMESIIAALKAITAIKCETPCGAGGNGCGGSCKIIDCARERDLKGCWECDDIDKCPNLEFLQTFHGQGIIINLRQIKKYGPENWTEHRAKCYPWL